MNGAFTESRGLAFAWPTSPAVRNVDFAVRGGEMVAIVGPNGAGKSTLLRLLSGYLKPQAGAVFLEGKPMREWSRRDIARQLALVPQYSQINLPYTVEALVSFGRYPHVGPFAALTVADQDAVARALAYTETAALAGRPITALSGGEFQRVVLARALAQEPRLIYLDEPTAHLDFSHQVRLFGLLRRLNREAGLTVVAVLHDLNAAAAYFERVVIMAAGTVAADGEPRRVLEGRLLSSIYGCEIYVTAVENRLFIYPLTAS
jgi:iron complex transport system ATP-binding protein